MLVISGNLILTGAWTTMFCRIKIYKRWLCAIVHTFCSIDCSHLKLKNYILRLLVSVFLHNLIDIETFPFSSEF